MWDDIAEQLKTIGLGAANTAAQNVANKVTGGSSGNSEVKQDPSSVQQNPWNGGLTNLNTMQIAGVGLPILLAGAAVIYFAVRK